ncbi:glycoside hydrolase family 36 protein [Flavitalea antarctica]
MKVGLFVLCLICPSMFFAQTTAFASWTNTLLTLNNGQVKRTIELPGKQGHLLTQTYQPQKGDFNLFTTADSDFSFEMNGQSYTGKSKWTLKGIQAITDSLQGQGAGITLVSSDKKIELIINLLLYPALPVIRKKLIIKNLTDKAMMLESVDVEKLTTNKYLAPTYSWIYSDYGRRKSIGPFAGSRQDPLVIVHNPDIGSGVAIGNEAAGVIKNTQVFWDAAEIIAGLSHKNDRYPFRKWLQPGTVFATPDVFTIVYNNQKNPEALMSTVVADYVRKHMGIRLSGLSEKPTFVYNTWHPFRKEINEKLIRELAKSAADAGMKEFVIDDGWETNFGDWEVDKKKFPNGLKPVFDYIKSLGMKPGLWVSVGSASPESRVYSQHPEWFVKDKNGRYANLHIEGDGDQIRSACFSTGWKNYIKDILVPLIKDNGIEYLKLDFSVVTSAYVFNPEKSGCYATNHPGHKDQHESLVTNYDYMWELFDELHAAKNNLFIDCTFEAMGGLQLIDYAMLKHAEGNWLSNFYQADDVGDLRIRNMAWWRAPAVSATALVIGNPRMDDKGWEMHIKSLAGSLPIMLGDPRKLTSDALIKYRVYADWLQQMQTKHDFMSYRQDLPVFGEPADGQWDGFQRINTESGKGGIIGVFRHHAPEARRKIQIGYLEPDTQYEVKNMAGKVVETMSGFDLQNKGFEIQSDALYFGELFEIDKRK